MKIDEEILIGECLELISLHKNIQCDQSKNESDLDWYRRIQTLLHDIQEEPDRNSAKDRSAVLIKAINELIADKQ